MAASSPSSVLASEEALTGDELKSGQLWDEIVTTVVYPAVRLLVALVVVWFASSFSKNQRFFSGLVSGLFSGFLTFTFLEPLFVPVGSETAMVFLYILVTHAALVGMGLGVLLPMVFAGVCFGGAAALMVGTVLVIEFPLYFPIAVAAAAVLGAILSACWSPTFFISMATAIEFGAVASCIVLKPMLPYFMDIARGYPYYPHAIISDHAADSIISGAGNLTVEGENVTDINAGQDEEESPFPSVQKEILLGWVWVASSLLVAATSAYRDKSFANFNLIGMIRPGYSAISTMDDDDEAAAKAAAAALAAGANGSSTRKVLPAHRDPPMVHDAYNMFDPADLPPRLAEYANMVYSACEDLGNFFGFQDSSVRNQAENLLILLSNNRRYMSSHILPPSVQPPSPIHALHAKVFSNYVKWCRAMGVPPHFSKMNTSMNAPPAVASRVVDLVLFFCIWGEGANLRHIPECIWFLYHKMMEEYIQSEGYTQTRSLYAGHYLDNVVNPIYEVIAKEMKSNADHQNKRNYDDFNEFFWSRSCLTYQYSLEDPSKTHDSDDLGMTGAMPGEDSGLIPVSEGLAGAPKTFLEKRSWLRGILALHRILEWHIVTFYLLATLAFSRELVWGWVHSLQVASAVFWIFNALHLTWQLLEVWACYPGIKLSGTAVCGSIFILVARFLCLVYQTLYLMWAFFPQHARHLGIEADSTFWWWQYIWLSLLVMIPYFMEAQLQLVPSWAAKIYTSQNDYIQSFLNILYPLSRLYVGKEVQESVAHVAVYAFFWITMMAWKLCFSYIFEVYSMVLPSLQLTDDYANYPDQSFTKMLLLLSLRWLPQFIVYLIDMSIWYAAWQAFAGTSVGFSDHLGDIRSMDDIRNNFGRAPESFCKKMLSPDAGSRRGSSASFLGSVGTDLSEGISLLGADMNKLQSYVNRLLDVRIQKWVMFSAAWNEIIEHFRTEDIISNAESDNLKFSQFDGFSQAIYLPVFQTAGVIGNVLSELERPAEEYKAERSGSYTDESFFRPINRHITMQTAVAEVWELGAFFFQQVLGPLHSGDIQAVVAMINKWMESGEITAHMKLESIRKSMDDFVGAVNILHQGITSRKPALQPRSTKKKRTTSAKPKAPTSGGMRRVVSAGSISSMETDKPRDTKVQDAKPVEEPEEIIDALRDKVRDQLRNLVHSIKRLLKNTDVDAESRDVLDRLTFLASMENGFFWDDAYASDQLDDISKNNTFKAVLKKIHGLVCMHPDDAEPKSKEARRRLTFFVNSLFMDMPDAPSIHDMFSWNVLTPYYSEDVTYSKSDLEKRTDALGVSTLLYLQTLFKADWSNFLERLGIKDEEKIWSAKYVDETRRWASNRAQTLSRTVNGMMYCEKALRLIANLERLDDDTTNDLIREKFGYVVACQVYGDMKRNQDSKADDIEALMHRFLHLRIAYIDNIRVNRSGASVYYSVLVKSDGKGHIEEVYRVRLPGNPVIGEGKPENQNHAMIFTRGEFVQTIDMNQEGYFEEALKMRNCLQEFAKREGPLPTTILGLREHIFTGSVSSLANYMALQEISFVTLGQRVLANPLHIRLHYGHPDIFDKLFFITRGGISKSSKGINLSEDIFAGYANVIRGGSIGFKEYVQIGKGRDVGMSQIYKFEAKLSQGAAEQSLSRDVYRMCNRLDFFRLLSFYYGGIGHYFSNVLTILTVWIVVWLMAILALFNIEKIGDRMITPMGTIQMLLGGLGLLQTIPLFATLGVERGWWASLVEIFQVFITGGPLHFMFHIQTKATYMAQTILVGGAKYRPTGRGFVTQHTPFDEQYRFFATSHLYLGVELAAGLLLMGIYSNAGQYFGRTWSLWLASASFLCSPFWFNPLTFDWNVCMNDYDLWFKWIRGTSGGSTKSWSMWYNEENAFYKGMPFVSKLVYFIKAALYLVIGEGIRQSNLLRRDTSLYEPLVGVRNLTIFLVVLVVFGRVFSASRSTLPYPVRRTIGILIFSGVFAGILTLFIEDSNYIRYGISAYYTIGAFCLIGLMYGLKPIKYFYLIHDIVCAHIIFIPLFVLAALQLPGMIQTWLLYHNALSTDVVVSDILRYARRTQESGSGGENTEDLTEQINELKKLVQRQEVALTNAGILSTDPNTPIMAVSGVMSTTPEPVGGRRGGGLSASTPPTYMRAVSMSGMDVWGDMVLGDVRPADVHQNAEFLAPSMTQVPHTSHGGFSFTQPDDMPPR